MPTTVAELNVVRDYFINGPHDDHHEAMADACMTICQKYERYMYDSEWMKMSTADQKTLMTRNCSRVETMRESCFRKQSYRRRLRRVV